MRENCFGGVVLPVEVEADEWEAYGSDKLDGERAEE